MREHHTRLLVTPSADPGGAPTSDTPALAVLRFAYACLGTQSADGASPLSSLLSGSPRSQHDLSEGVHEKSADELLASLSSEADRARVRSCGGQWAGLWLAAAPRSWFARVRGVHYSIALRVRLGVPLRELQPRDGAASVTCGGCGRAVDAFGRHYSSCKNRGNCWTHRHDCVEMSLIRQARIGRARATSTAGQGNLFGTPALSSKKSLRYGWRSADIVLWNYYAPARHLFLDVAVADPCSATALRAHSADTPLAAAASRARVKKAKYDPLAAHAGHVFKPAVMERFGACGDDLQLVVKLLSGDGERDPFRADDYVFSTRSRTTYFASDLVLSCVISDAHMIALLAEADVAGRPLSHAAACSHSARRPTSHGTPHCPASSVCDRRPLWYETGGVYA